MAAGAKVREPRIRGSQRGKTGAGGRQRGRVAGGYEVDEVYWYGELDNAIGGKLIDWGATKIDSCRYLVFKMPDGRIIQVFIDWPNVW
jgi:hypothetical protein